MRQFRVWAPAAAKVDLQAGQTRAAMIPQTGGWWAASVPEGEGIGGYGFILDGNGPYPDPRSPWQPGGVEGLSRPVDHAQFVWTDADWQAPPLSSAIIYELHIGTFTPGGTFEAAIEGLDHLVRLGITHVELMPVNEFAGARGWGYDGVDLYAPHHIYGGPVGLKRLVDACHARRLAVLLDVVYNHLGPVGNYLAKYGPYFSQRHSSFWGTGLNFDEADSAEVRRFFCDNALMWLRDFHIDGLRLDAVHGITDTSAVHFLEQLALEVSQLEAQLGRRLVLIAESDLNDPRLLWSPERGGYGLHAQWSDDFHHALHALLTGETNGYYTDYGSLADLDRALRQAFVYHGGYSRHRRRPHGRPPTGLSGHRFLGYAQNHDQIGNRAQGDRSNRLMSAGRLRIAAALVLAGPFVPMLFQGEEWGASTPFLYFTDFADPQLGGAVRENRRKEFAAFNWKMAEVPDPQALETFERSKLDWSELALPPHHELLEWHRRLIDLRRGNASLTNGRLDLVNTRFDEVERFFMMTRGDVVVACNLGLGPMALHLPEGKHCVQLASEPAIAIDRGVITLPPDSVVILTGPSGALR